ncbi:MAG: leucine-rich repeat domain-containing protein [Muribaculaceae bacterium]|nr:leucine-rich repeat domain-containing protein [Muribaculaceae bacterium]
MNRIFNKIVIMMTMLLSAVSLAGNAQEYVVPAYDVVWENCPEGGSFPGIHLEEHVVATETNGVVVYTDNVEILLNNHTMSVIFLSEENKEVALQNNSRFDYFGTDYGERIPDYIEYKGEKYKVVELSIVANSNKVVVPNTVRRLMGLCFFGVNEVDLGKSVELLGRATFSCPEMTALKMPESVIYMQQRALTGNTYETFKLQSIEFSPNLRTIESNNFNYFPYIEEISMPQKLSYLGENCFNNLTGLKRVYIGQYLMSMKNCFNNCSAIEEIFIDKWYPIKIEDCFNEVDKSKCVIKVSTLTDPDGKDVYIDDFWKDFKIVEIDASGVETIINDPANGVYNTRWYDLSGRPLSSIDGLKRGEIYIECQGSKSEKKIMD